MAYTKKPLPINSDIKEEWDEQEDRIASEFDKRADFVVEQGTNYTKWNSGKLEQWGKIEKTLDVSSPYGALYRTKLNQVFSFPINFIEPPFLTLDSMMYSVFSAYLNEISFNSFNWRPVHVTSGQKDVLVGWNAIGRWK